MRKERDRIKAREEVRDFSKRCSLEREIFDLAKDYIENFETKSGSETRLGLILARPQQVLRLRYPDIREDLDKYWNAVLKKRLRLRIGMRYGGKMLINAMIVRCAVQGILGDSGIVNTGRVSSLSKLVLRHARKEAIYALVSTGSNPRAMFLVYPNVAGGVSKTPIHLSLSSYISVAH